MQSNIEIASSGSNTSKTSASLDFEVIQFEDGSYRASCFPPKEDIQYIYAEGDNLAQLHYNITNAIDLVFKGRKSQRPRQSDVRLHIYCVST